MTSWAVRTHPWLALLWQMLELKDTLDTIWLSLSSEELGSQGGMQPSPLGAGVGHLKFQAFSHSVLGASEVPAHCHSFSPLLQLPVDSGSPE